MSRGGEERNRHPPDSDICASFLPIGAADAVFVFFMDIGRHQVAVGCLDKNGNGGRWFLTLCC